MLTRRVFLRLAGGTAAATLGGCRLQLDQGITNPCFAPSQLGGSAVQAVLARAWNGIDPQQVWDCHVHLTGVGDNGSLAWANPTLREWWHVFKHAQFQFYKNAACVADGEHIDDQYVERLLEQINAFPVGSKAMLLAFDFYHGTDGIARPDLSTFYMPNDYCRRIAQQHPARFEWIASIHPYRDDALATLRWAHGNGARASKWLPVAMGMDPSSARCDAFYAVMAELNMPLLSHAGDEHAVDSNELQRLTNPLLLRRALDHGVHVVVAHCASIGASVDLDQGENGPRVANIDLFGRLMDEKRYQSTLFGDISAVMQINRDDETIRKIFVRREWHTRLLNGSDYPLPGVMPLTSLQRFVDLNYLTPDDAATLTIIRQHNALLGDFALKRLLVVEGNKLPAAVFETRTTFDHL